MDDKPEVIGEYIVIKALENGVTIIGLTRGKDTKFHHTEKLDKGEIMIAQFTEYTLSLIHIFPTFMKEFKFTIKISLIQSSSNKSHFWLI